MTSWAEATAAERLATATANKKMMDCFMVFFLKRFRGILGLGSLDRGPAIREFNGRLGNGCLRDQGGRFNDH